MGAVPACKKQLENLVDIKVDSIAGPVAPAKRKKLVLREALADWKEKVQASEAKEETRAKRTDQLTNEIYQLVGLYSVFVGVVFTAVLQSSRVECQHIWSPITLCVVAFLVILFVINNKANEIEHLRRLIEEEKSFRRRSSKNITLLKEKGVKGFDFTTDVDEFKRESDKNVNSGKFNKSTKAAVVVVLAFFTLVLVFSFYHILCRTKSRECSCSP